MTIDEAITTEIEYSQPCDIICKDGADCNDCRSYHRQLAEWLEELKQYRQIGTVEECREAVEKQKKGLSVDEAKRIAAKTICSGCGYLADCKCDYNGGNCMVSKPMLESVLKSFDDWNRRVNDDMVSEN